MYDSSLVTADGVVLPVSGDVDGLGLTLIFALGEGQQITGVGTLEQPLESCAGSLGGTLSGPLPEDVDDWKGFRAHIVR